MGLLSRRSRAEPPELVQMRETTEQMEQISKQLQKTIFGLQREVQRLHLSVSSTHSGPPYRPSP